MSLRDELPAVRQLGGTCTVNLLFAALSPDTAEELRQLFDDPQVASSQLAQLARSKGWNVQYEAIKRHRRKVCKCP